MSSALVADTGGLLRALARDPDGGAAFPDFETALVSASAIIVPCLVLVEIDWFLRRERPAMRRLVAEMLDPATTYELEPLLATDLARALELDAHFKGLRLGLVDGQVAAVAERRGIERVLTTDRRDFSALRVGPDRERALTLVP